MDKLAAVRIKYDDGTYSEEIPLKVTAENVAWDQEHDLVDILGTVNLQTGDVQQQLDGKINYSELNTYMQSQISTDVSNWLSANIHEDPTVIIDKNLSISDAAADAKKTGDEIAGLKEDLNEIGFDRITFATLSNSDLENGALNSDGINVGSMTYRVRTTGYVELPQSDSVYIIVTSDKDISFCAVQYDVNDFTTPKLKYGPWQKPGRVDLVDGAKYLRLVFSINQTTENISPSDIESVDLSSTKASVVKFTAQTLTDAEKAQARKNIGAMSDNDGWISNFVVSNGYLCQKVEVI